MYVVVGKNKHQKLNIKMDKLSRFLKERGLNSPNLTQPNLT